VANSTRKTRIAGVHRVKKKLSSGVVRNYHYAFRGGPKFWSDESGFDETDPRYVASYQAALTGTCPVVYTDTKTTSHHIERYRNSAEYNRLKPRTQKDYEKYLQSFDAEFGVDPIKMFEEEAAVGQIREWRSIWSNSPKQYDYAGSVVTTFLTWCVEADKAIAVHHHKGQKKHYRSNRAQTIWLPAEIEMLLNEARPEEVPIVVAFSEGGLAPQDVGLLSRKHVQETPKGRRLFFRRQKTDNPVSLPVTEALGRLIDALPQDQELLVTSLTGEPLKALRASQIIRDIKLRHNEKVEQGLLPVRIRDELRPYDMRGTAATALLRAGCSLNEIAVTMGWGLRHASNVIERYAALVPEVTDEVHKKLLKAKRKDAKAKRKNEKETGKRK
jgi:integrase